MEMTMEAQEKRKDYQRQYRTRNRDRINARQREWCSRNRDRVREYQNRYWEKQAGKKNIRASWADYGIDKARYQELLRIARSDEYAGVALAAALKAGEKAAGHILLSVARGLSYEYIEFDSRLGRCMLGRANFYGARRLFFHYLDCALREMEESPCREDGA